MEDKRNDFSEEWEKIISNDIPEGEYIVTSFSQDMTGTKSCFLEKNVKLILFLMVFQFLFEILLKE